MTRGPRCAELEKQHATKLEELAKAQADKDATDNLITIEAALSADKEELKTIGPKAEHTDELDGFVLFLTNFGMTSERAKALVANKPATDTLNFEFLACFGVAPSIMLWIRLLAFLTCQTGEAEERVKAVTMAVAEDLANRAVADMPANENEIPAPKAKPFTFFDEAKEPEPDHAAALGIEGEDHPAFVSAPKTREEAIAAAFLKVDKTKKPRGARKRTEAHKSSVVQWHKERCFAAPGRVTWSTHARPDYESWCAGLNLEPVNPKLFGMTLRNECGVLAEPKSKGTKYFDIGLRAGGLRIVAG